MLQPEYPHVIQPSEVKHLFLLEVPLKKVGVFSKGHLTMLTVALSTSFIHYCMSSWLGFTIIPKYLLVKNR